MTQDDRDPAITLASSDGGLRFRYYAASDERYPPEQVGWVLVIDGGVTPLDPQALSATEVASDLAKQGADNAVMLDILRSCTRDMLNDLRRRADESEGAPSAELAQRITELSAELEGLPDPDDSRSRD